MRTIIITQNIEREESIWKRKDALFIRPERADDIRECPFYPLVVFSDYFFLQFFTGVFCEFLSGYEGEFVLLSSVDCIPVSFLEWFDVLEKEEMDVEVVNRGDGEDLSRFVDGEGVSLWRVIKGNPSFYPIYHTIRTSTLPKKGTLFSMFMKGKG